MPVRELIAAMDPPAPAEVRRVSDGLVYRDFITVGLLASRLTLENPDGRAGLTVRDNWIYIQEPDVLVGRLQIFNNWSPYLVADPSRVWIGLEYFCNEDDELWRKPDDEMIALAVSELERIDIAAPADILDGTVIRMAKTYPAYFGTYGKFDKIVQWVNRLENLWLVGRNGMHRYNNQDHSMLTAMVAVDNIERGVCDHASVWAVNTEQEYHESRQVESR
jgi:protoporphyrinogen oxidase